MEVRGGRGITLAMRWIIRAAKSKKGKEATGDGRPVTKKSAGTAKGTKKSSEKSKKVSAPKTDDKSEEKS